VIEPDKDLSADEWRELEAADPDRIQAFSPLKDEWVERFHARLIPWKIAVEELSKKDEPTAESPEARWQHLHDKTSQNFGGKRGEFRAGIPAR
jgi:hypothetical protein